MSEKVDRFIAAINAGCGLSSYAVAVVSCY